MPLDTMKIAASTVCLSDSSLHAAIDRIRLLGFSGIGIPAFSRTRNRFGEIPGFSFDEMTEEERDHLKEELQTFEGIVFHAPYQDLPLFSINRGIQLEAIRQIRETIEAAWYFGAQVVMVRTGCRSFYRFEEYRDEILLTLRDLGDFAEECGVKLAIATGFPETVREYTMLFLEIDHDAIGASVHLGDLFTYMADASLKAKDKAERYNEVLMQLIRTLGSEIYHIQASDVRSEDMAEGRRSLGRGIVRFEPIIQFLKQIDYEGMIEIAIEEEKKEEALAESQAYLELIIQFLKRIDYEGTIEITLEEESDTGTLEQN